MALAGKVPDKLLKVFIRLPAMPLKCRVHYNKIRNSWEDSSRDSD